MTLASLVAKPALLSFEDDQKLICSLWEENTELKKKVRRDSRDCFGLIFWLPLALTSLPQLV